MFNFPAGWEFCFLDMWGLTTVWFLFFSLKNEWLYHFSECVHVSLHRVSEIWSGAEMRDDNALIMQYRCRYSDVQVEGALCFPLVLYNIVRLISRMVSLWVVCILEQKKKNFSYTLERTMCHWFVMRVYTGYTLIFLPLSCTFCNIIHHDLPRRLVLKPVTAIDEHHILRLLAECYCVYKLM